MTTSDNPSNDKVSTADRDTAAASPTKGRRFNVFSNLNIGVRLGLGFGLLVVMIIIFAGVTLYTTQLQDVALEEFRAAEEETLLIVQLEIELLEARLLEEKFELRHEQEGYETAFANYIVPNQQHTQKMLVLAEEARANLTGETERDLRDIADLEQIALDIDEYEATIVGLAANIEIRGDSTSGLEGLIITDLDDLTHQLDVAGELAVEVLGFEVLEQFLEYNIDRGTNHVESFKSGMVTLISAIQNDDALSQTEKTSLLSLAEEASTSFDQLLVIDAAITAEEAILEADGLDIKRLSEEIIADERAIEAEAFAEFKNIEQLAQTLDVGIALAAILLGSIVAVFVTRSITGPVTHLTAVAEKVSTGDLNAEAHIESGDELGILALAFNRMTVQLRASIDTLEERVATRTQLLETSVEKLHESELSFRQLAENIDLVFWLSSVDGDDMRLLYVSPAFEKIFGRNLEDYLKKRKSWRDSLDSIHPDDRQHVIRAKEKQTTEEHDIEYRIVLADGSLRWIRGRNRLIRNERGEVYRMAGISEDITQRKQAEGLFLQTQKMESLGILAGGVAHDFNNLLVAILGQTSLVQNKLPANSPVRSNIDKAVKAAERAADLTRQMLAYSGRGHFESHPIHINTLIDDNVHLFEAAIPKFVQLRSQLDDKLPLIEADRGQIQQVIMNLIINGAEAMGDQRGTVTIATYTQNVDSSNAHTWQQPGVPLEPGLYVTLKVEDNGSGMDTDTLSKIFDPFFTTKFTGRGLGLAATLGIVRGHRGGLRVRSEVGKGTTFELLFPASEVALVEPIIPEEVFDKQSGLVLVIDDEETVRQAVTDILTQESFDVITAVDGAVGTILYQERMTDVQLVLLDLSMPGMSSEETLNELRRINPEVRVILSSGYTESDAIGSFKVKKLDRFLQKPYSAEELVSIVRQHLIRT